MNVEEVLKNKTILYLRNQVADFSIKLAESEAKSALFKELLQLRDQELATERAKDEKKMKKTPDQKEVK